MRLAAVLLLAPALCLAEPATVIRATELKQAPATDAATVASLAENAKVNALDRKGGWTRVKAEGGAEGWVRMLSLRYAGTGEAKAGDSGVSQLLSVARSGTSGTQVTTGVRGLDQEQLANAKPNAAELKKMENYSVSRDRAEDFARKGHLSAQRVDYPQEGAR
jgi:hypothetical protein